MIVVDASALLEVLLRTEVGRRAERRILRRGQTLHAPHLIDVEIAQVVRRYAMMGDLERRRGAEVLADLADIPLHRYPHTLLLPRVWELRLAVTAYDAVYVALAEALDAPLITRDARLGRAKGHAATVELV